MGSTINRILASLRARGSGPQQAEMGRLGNPTVQQLTGQDIAVGAPPKMDGNGRPTPGAYTPEQSVLVPGSKNRK